MMGIALSSRIGEDFQSLFTGPHPMCGIVTSTLALLSMTALMACTLAPPAPLPSATPPPTLTAASATPSTAPPAQIGASSSWIEVDLAGQTVILHEGGRVIAEYPASTGVTTDPKYATPPGAYRVQSKEKGPIESVPGVFVSDVVMFDIRLGNGFHSRPMDADGNILDATLGRPTTAGCVRVCESARLFEFAQIGMWVWIHWRHPAVPPLERAGRVIDAIRESLLLTVTQIG